MNNLKSKVEVLSRKKVEFKEKDLADKKRIDLLVGGKKVDGSYIMKGEKSNTTKNELKEAMLLTYCMKNHYII